MAQVHQRGQQPVEEHQPVPGIGSAPSPPSRRCAGSASAPGALATSPPPPSACCITSTAGPHDHQTGAVTGNGSIRQQGRRSRDTRRLPEPNTPRRATTSTSAGGCSMPGTRSGFPQRRTCSTTDGTACAATCVSSAGTGAPSACGPSAQAPLQPTRQRSLGGLGLRRPAGAAATAAPGHLQRPHRGGYELCGSSLKQIGLRPRCWPGFLTTPGLDLGPSCNSRTYSRSL